MYFEKPKVDYVFSYVVVLSIEKEVVEGITVLETYVFCHLIEKHNRRNLLLN